MCCGMCITETRFPIYPSVLRDISTLKRKYGIMWKIPRNTEFAQAPRIRSAQTQLISSSTPSTNMMTTIITCKSILPADRKTPPNHIFLRRQVNQTHEHKKNHLNILTKKNEKLCLCWKKNNWKTYDNK